VSRAAEVVALEEAAAPLPRVVRAPALEAHLAVHERAAPVLMVETDDVSELMGDDCEHLRLVAAVLEPHGGLADEPRVAELGVPEAEGLTPERLDHDPGAPPRGRDEANVHSAVVPRPCGHAHQAGVLARAVVVADGVPRPALAARVKGRMRPGAGGVGERRGGLSDGWGCELQRRERQEQGREA